MKKEVSKITDFLALTVFAVFAVCVLIVLLYGARVYRNLVHRGGESFETHTAVQYVSTRVRQAETITVTDFEGCSALTAREQIDGAIYVTRVYCYEGYMRELYCAENAALPPEAGEKIMPVEDLCFSVENDLLTVFIGEKQLFLQLKSIVCMCIMQKADVGK